MARLSGEVSATRLRSPQFSGRQRSISLALVVPLVPCHCFVS
jgi:hypothetical protein